MNWYEKIMVKISLFLISIGVKIGEYATKNLPDMPDDPFLPFTHPYPEHDPWGNFATREGEHDYV